MVCFSELRIRGALQENNPIYRRVTFWAIQVQGFTRIETMDTDDNALGFVVHNFSYRGTPPTQTLLGIGRSLVHAATSSVGWVSAGKSVARNPPKSGRGMPVLPNVKDRASYQQGAFGTAYCPPSRKEASKNDT